MNKNILLICFFILLILGLFGAYYAYNQPNLDKETQQLDKEVTQINDKDFDDKALDDLDTAAYPDTTKTTQTTTTQSATVTTSDIDEDLKSLDTLGSQADDSNLTESDLDTLK